MDGYTNTIHLKRFGLPLADKQCFYETPGFHKPQNRSVVSWRPLITVFLKRVPVIISKRDRPKASGRYDIERSTGDYGGLCACVGQGIQSSFSCRLGKPLNIRITSPVEAHGVPKNAMSSCESPVGRKPTGLFI
jgi:hypothetical protein